jgi:hypothetical protein
MSNIPFFTDDGLLPPGTYQLTFEELRSSHLVTGLSSSDPENWETEWRMQLVKDAEALVNDLWKVGIEEVFLDGSFVEDKGRPGDIYGYYNCLSLEEFQFQIHPKLCSLNQIWVVEGLGKSRIWEIFRVEFYPNFGQCAGLFDEFGNQLTFPSAFRRTRDNKQKGIIQIVKEKNL